MMRIGFLLMTSVLLGHFSFSAHASEDDAFQGDEIVVQVLLPFTVHRSPRAESSIAENCAVLTGTQNAGAAFPQLYFSKGQQLYVRAYSNREQGTVTLDRHDLMFESRTRRQISRGDFAGIRLKLGKFTKLSRAEVKRDFDCGCFPYLSMTSIRAGKGARSGGARL